MNTSETQGIDFPVPRDRRIVEPGTEAAWPSASQELLLRAAVMRGPAAIAAWAQWKSRHDLVESQLDAGSFRLLPLVYKNLVEHGSDDPDLPRLKGMYRYWWCFNQVQLFRASHLIRELHSAGINTLVLKGAGLAITYYRDTGVRPMADVDVLVPLNEARRALDHLGALGWQPVTPHIDEELRYRHSTPMVHRTSEEFDFHWHALREGLSAESDTGFWKRAVPLRLVDIETRTLGPADALLHAIVHGLRWNAEPAIRWVPDAMAVLRSAGEHIDWERLVSDARRHRLVVRLAKGIEYLHRTFDAPIPASALESLRRARHSPTEWLEYRYFALGAAQRHGLLLGYAPFVWIEYLRVAAGKSIMRAAMELPGFLRYRLRGRVEPPIMAARRVARAARWIASPARRMSAREGGAL